MQRVIVFNYFESGTQASVRSGMWR